MIFLIIQAIKENTNHSGFVEMMVTSSFLGYLFFKKIKPFKKLDKNASIKFFFILGVLLFGLAFLFSSLVITKFLVGITILLGLLMLGMSVTTLISCGPAIKKVNKTPQ
jgi:hypothetical protein